MSNPTVLFHNIETGEILEREMNAEELEQWELDKADNETIKQTKVAKETQRQALLDKLGITEDEAKLLLS